MAKLLSSAQTAKRFGITAKTLQRNRALIVARHKLTPIRVGRFYRYNSDQVDKLVKKLTRTGESLYYLPTPSETAEKS